MRTVDVVQVLLLIGRGDWARHQKKKANINNTHAPHYNIKIKIKKKGKEHENTKPNASEFVPLDRLVTAAGAVSVGVVLCVSAF